MRIVIESGPLRGRDVTLVWTEQGYRGVLEGGGDGGWAWVLDPRDEPVQGQHHARETEAREWLDDLLHRIFG